MEHQSRIPAIVVSAQTPGLAVIRGLGTMGVPVSVLYYDDSDMGYVSRYVTRRSRVPHPEHEHEAFLDALSRHCSKLGEAIIFPTDDASLKTLSRHKHTLPSGIRAACPDWPIVHGVIDKHYTYTLAAEHGIPAPKSYAVESTEDLRTGADEIGFPVLLKPRESHLYVERFGKKVTRAESWPELAVEFTKCEDAGCRMLLQEFIPGDEACGVNYNAYRTRTGRSLEFTAEKVCLATPDFGPPCVVVSNHLPDIVEPGRRLLEIMEFEGFACTEFKKDERDGVYKLMEVNARHNRSAMLALHCGVNFPYMEYDYILNGTLPEEISYKDGIYWTDSISYLRRVIRYHERLPAEGLRFIKQCFRADVDATFNWQDKRPFIKRVFGLLRP